MTKKEFFEELQSVYTSGAFDALLRLIDKKSFYVKLVQYQVDDSGIIGTSKGRLSSRNNTIFWAIEFYSIFNEYTENEFFFDGDWLATMDTKKEAEDFCRSMGFRIGDI